MKESTTGTYKCLSEKSVVITMKNPMRLRETGIYHSEVEGNYEIVELKQTNKIFYVLVERK